MCIRDRVVEGMDAVDEIASCETGAQDRPLREQKIQMCIRDSGRGAPACS